MLGGGKKERDRATSAPSPPPAPRLRNGASRRPRPPPPREKGRRERRRLHRTHSEFESRTKDFLPRSLQSFALPRATLSGASLLSLGTFRREPAKRWFDESFAPIQSSEE